jgi:hypothetical protein
MDPNTEPPSDEIVSFLTGMDSAIHGIAEEIARRRLAPDGSELEVSFQAEDFDQAIQYMVAQVRDSIKSGQLPTYLGPVIDDFVAGLGKSGD